jgi:hypothetical protein
MNQDRQKGDSAAVSRDKAAILALREKMDAAQDRAKHEEQRVDLAQKSVRSEEAKTIETRQDIKSDKPKTQEHSPAPKKH